MRILFFLPNLEGGGAQKVVLNLLAGFVKKKYEVILVVAIPSGTFLNDIPAGVKLVHLNLKRSSKAVMPLMKVIKQEKPDIIYSIMNYANIITILASILAGSKAKIIALIANTLTEYHINPDFKTKALFALTGLCYKRANLVVANSHDTYDDLIREKIAGPDKLKVIFNPIVDFDDINARASQPIGHAWLEDKSTPVMIAVGRLSPQKNFSFLISAFEEVKKKSDARLIILGEGVLRGELEAQVAAAGLQDTVSMPGFTNPFPFYKHADAFILSSKWEGFGNVIVEAFACGCPVISSNCPGGPKEILDNGKYGVLINDFDTKQFADAILAEIAKPTPKAPLIARSGDFAIDKIVEELEEATSKL